jgi:1-acyl-sn-glycerol-3-phosphate acyltransferase
VLSKIRSGLFFLSLGINTLIFAVLIIFLSFILQSQSANRLANLWSKCNAKLLQWICRVHLVVTGSENIPADSGFIVVSNHQSVLETLLLRGIFYSYDQAWVLKEELLAIPFFGYALKRSGQIPINRKASKSALKALINKGKYALENNNQNVFLKFYRKIYYYLKKRMHTKTNSTFSFMTN